MLLKKDEFLTLETGEYSDFTYIGPFIVLKDFDTVEISEEYREKDPKKSEEVTYTYPNGHTVNYTKEEGCSPDRFISFLSSEGYIKDVENCTSWHVGSYEEFNPSI